MGLEVVGRQPSVAGYASEHSWADLLIVMEWENVVGPTVTSEHLVRAGLAFD